MATPTVREHRDSTDSAATAPFQLFADMTLRESQRPSIGSSTVRESDGLPRHTHITGATQVEQGVHEETHHHQDEDRKCPLEQYSLQDLLYCGAEANIHTAHRNLDGEIVILKLYHHGISPDPAILNRLQFCPPEQFIKILDHGASASGKYFEVLEYLPYGDLSSLLSGVRLPDYSVRTLLEELDTAIVNLQTPDTENHILVHRDIKPANILVRSALPFKIALCDFGITAMLNLNLPNAPQGKNFTPRYAAPEQLRGILHTKSDYWSLGIVLVEALCGTHPLADKSDAEINELIQSGWRPDLQSFSHEWQTLIAGLTESNSDDRWGHAEIKVWLETTGFEQAVEPEVVEEALPTQFDDLQSASPLELAARLAMCWPRIVSMLDNGEFHQWLSAEISRLNIDRTIAQLLDPPGTPDDIRMLRLVYRVAPLLPVRIWKEWRLSRSDMADYCTNAMNEDEQKRYLVEEIFNLEVLQEISTLCDDTETSKRSNAWHAAVHEYDQIVTAMVLLEAPQKNLPPRSTILPLLYLIECENGTGVCLFEADLTLQLRFFNPWLAPLYNNGDQSPSSAQRLLRSMYLPNCIDRDKQNFKIHHESGATSQRLEGRPSRSFGWNPPTIAITAEHIDYVMTMGDDKKIVAKGVHLRWEVRNALIIHLTRFGLIRSAGERPDERMAQRTVYSAIHECPCNDHNSAWFPVTHSTVFRIRAFNLLGFASMELPPITVPEPIIELDCPLDIQIPELRSAVEIDIPRVPMFEMSEKLFTPKQLELPLATQESLPETIPLEVSQFGRRDIWPEYYERIDAWRDKLRLNTRGNR